MPSRREFIKLSAASSVVTVLPNSPLPLATPSPAAKSARNPVIILRSSWGDGNIGDQGHPPGTIRLLNQYVPNAEILLWHVDPRPETEKLVSKYFPAVKIVRGKFYESGKLFEGEIKEAFERADLFMFNSGVVISGR